LPLEDWGNHVPEVGAGAPTVTMQQPVVQPLHDTRGFGDLLLTIANELGGALQQALPWTTYRDLLREAASQLAGVQGGSLSASQDLDQFWTSLLQHGVWTGPNNAPTPLAAGQASTSVSAAQASGDAQAYPYVLVPFAHHTLGVGETARLPWLQAAPDPVTSVVWQTWVELNPRVASRLGVREGDMVRLTSPAGQVEVPVYVSPAAPPDVLAVPLGQGHVADGRWAAGRGVNPLDLLALATDSSSGDLAFAATRVQITPTGRHVPLPKLEGDVPAYQLPGKEVLKVTHA
jgi:anaerobic selenocysteine-containing dehydrogenase